MYLEDSPEYLENISEEFRNYPTAINIELTTYCNLRCIMCPKTSGISRTPQNQHIRPEILDKIINEVLPYISRIDLVGDGEIFLKPDLVQRVLEAAEQHKILVNASTNGVLMTREISEMLVQHGMHDLNISLDAATPETFREIRGADLETVLENISQLNEIKRSYNVSVPNLHFSLVGMTRNIHELPDLVELAAKYDVHSVTLQAMGEFAPVENESVYLRDKKTGKIFLEKAERIGQKMGVQVDLWPHDQFEEVVSDTSTSSLDSPRKDCDFPWDVPYFATDGSVRPCCAMKPLGSLSENSFNEIWFGESYRALRRKMKSSQPPESCIKCPGRGWHAATVPSSSIQIGKNDKQLGYGWFHSEMDQKGAFRWAQKEASFFLKNNGGQILTLTLESASEPEAKQTVHVTVDNRPTASFMLSPGSPQKILINVPNIKGDIVKVRLSGHPWRPTDIIPENLDPRYLTFKFYGGYLSGLPVYTEFEKGIELVAIDFPTEFSIQKDDTFSISTFWRFRDVSLCKDIYVFVHSYSSMNSLNNLSFFIRDIQRKTKFTRSFFQADTRLPDPPVISGELFSLQVDARIPSDVRPGLYFLCIGLYSGTGKRLKILKTTRHSYRNGVVIQRATKIQP